MSVDYSSAIVVGLYRKDIEHEDLEELLYGGDLESFATYYDGNSDDFSIVGLGYLTSGSYRALYFDWDQPKIDSLKEEFRNITGQEAKVWLLPVGY